MKKPFLWTGAALIVLVGGFYALNAYIYDQKQGDAVADDMEGDGQRQRGDVVPTGLIGGGWTWVRTELPGGKVMDAPAGGKFVLSFDEDGLAWSTTDCNQMNGGYGKDGEVLSFKPFAMTKMYCEGSMEGEYARQLALTGSHVIEGVTLRLVLLKDAGTMFFSRDVAEPAEQPAVDPVTIDPITHASMVLTWGDVTIYNDPTGDASLYAGKAPADIVLLSDIHGDHFSPKTLEAVVAPETKIIAPQAVIDQLPGALGAQALPLANGGTIERDGITFTGIPMYNLPETADSRHVKGRGNGYVLQVGAYRIYIAGDTAGIPEMRALKDIDMAFVPMNGPTMPVEEAADAVLAFAPRQVYPYHYRSQTVLSDVALFKTLVNKGNPAIDVVQLDWYPPAK